MSSHKRKASEMTASSSSSESSSDSSVRPTAKEPVQKTTEGARTTSTGYIKVETTTSASIPSKKNRNSESVGDPLGNIIYVQVGPEKEKFGIHEKYIVRCSPFFQRVLEESKADIKLEPGSDYHVTTSKGTKYLFLPSEDPAIFKRFYVWLYEDVILDRDETIIDTTWENLFDVYLFALRCDIAGLNNSVVDASIEKHSKGHSLPASSNINRLYKTDIHAASFRTLFVDLFTQGDCDIAEAMRSSKYNPQFLGALVTALDKQKKVIHNKIKKIRKKMVSKMGQNETDDFKIDFMKHKEKYYVYGEKNPVELSP